MAVSPNLIKYLKILNKSSKGFKLAIKHLNGQIEEERLNSFMDEFFIPKTKNNKIYMRGFLMNKSLHLKFTTHVNTLASAKNPCRSPEVSYPHFMIIVGEYMTPEEWMDAYKFIKKEDGLMKKQGSSSIMDIFKRAESRLVRTWKTIDLKLEVYRIYKKLPYPQRVADKISSMKSSGIFPIKTGTTFDVADIRRVVTDMDELLEAI